MSEHDPTMAPPDLSWHEEYERVFQLFERELDRLRNHESFEQSEDLGDYIEALSTLLSFRPRTRDDIVRKVTEEVHPGVFDEVLEVDE